ncbi:MAG: hypothetical protein ABI780_10380 [Ardenticatenales bacterium]
MNDERATAMEPAPEGADAAPVRLFVPSGALRDRTLDLDLDAASAAALAERGLVRGDHIIALDGSGWASTVELTAVSDQALRGRVVDRRLAPARRSKVSVLFSPLDPARTHDVMMAATAAGVVSIAQVFTSASRVDVAPAEPAVLAPAVQAAAESAGWGRLPRLGAVGFLDQAVDHAARAGACVLIAAAGAPPAAEALADRPFTIALFCPTAGAFTSDELTRADARGARMVVWEGAWDGADGGGGAVAGVRRALDAIYAALEG